MPRTVTVKNENEQTVRRVELQPSSKDGAKYFIPHGNTTDPDFSPGGYHFANLEEVQKHFERVNPSDFEVEISKG